MPSICFIIPVFNMENYISICLESLLTQTSGNWTAILVDDGSTDKSLEICESFAASDSRFLILTQENAGQGAARNRGLSYCTSDYVAFVDPDDWIEPSYVEVLYALVAQEDPADFLNFGLDFRSPEGRVIRSFKSFEMTELVGEHIFIDSLLDLNVHTSPCNKLYSVDFLRTHNIRFPEIRAYEDVYFSRMVSLKAARCLFLSDVLYHALVRHGSTTRVARPDRVRLALDLLNIECVDFQIRASSQYIQSSFRAHGVKLMLYLLYQLALGGSDYRTFSNAWMDYRRSNYFEIDWKVFSLLSNVNRVMWMLARSQKIAYIASRCIRLLGYKSY